MKTVRMSAVLAGVVGAATLFLFPVSMSAAMGWDVFYTGEGEPFSSSYQRTPPTGLEGKGFDVFNMGDGVKVADFEKAYVGTSLGSEASDGWDVFHTGQGDRVP